MTQKAAPGMEKLKELMTDRQIMQLVEILQQAVDHRYAEVHVRVVGGEVRFFELQLSIRACFEADSSED